MYLISCNFLLSSSFTFGDKSVSVVQYFRDRYNIGLKYTTLPAIQAGSDSKPIFLPMEVAFFYNHNFFVVLFWPYKRAIY